MTRTPTRGAGSCTRIAVIAMAAGCVLSAAPARAEAAPVLLMIEPPRRQLLAEALTVELAGREVEVLYVDPPEGATSLARAASAQAGARFVGGLAAIYVERSPEGGSTVRAVGPEGDLVRHAPLPHPVEEVDAGVFAVVAHSLIEELLGPPETPVTVRVQVSVDAPGREVTRGAARITGRAVEGEVRLDAEELEPVPPARRVVTEPVQRATPEPIQPARAAVPRSRVAPAALGPRYADQGWWEADEDAPLLPRVGLFAEGGVLFAGVGGGAQLGLGWHLAEAFRLSARTAVLFMFDGSVAYMPSLELARIGPDRSGRFDFGGGLGMVFIDTQHHESYSDTYYDVTRVGWVAHLFVGWTWELDGIGLGARGTLAVAGIEESGPIVAPMATLHAELPL